ncbi:hypothetical protein HNR43_002330 [Anoxybacillus mongoliensis]|uniref:Uncharacterized protein n=1 Tax=Anoxybacillus mongoliensis TaxID=452565 RepID=A0A7W8JFY6_9BACL|nr:hypothetical protein [Anoxybacillus mongoliensis]MBB5356346.1 hypothetical protein [Anoxybacillus mongoliensis]
MKWCSVLFRMIANMKLDVALISIYLGILVFYCINPYTINPAEFILYKKYLLPIGVVVWLLASFRLHFLIMTSTPVDWILMNNIIQKPKKIIANQITILFTCFFILQILIAGVVASAIVVNYSAGWDLFKFLFRLYWICFVLPFIWAWIIGLFISMIDAYYSHKKSMLLLSVFLLWIMTLFSLEYSPFQVFIENRFPYIDPLFSLTFLKENVWIQLVYVVCSIMICIVFMKMKRTAFGLAISVMLIISVTFTIYHTQTKFQLDDILLANDYKLYQHIKYKTHHNKSMTSNWRITGIEVEPESRYPIKVELTLDKKAPFVRFSMNEQFEIDHIKSGGKNLSFNQQGSIVEVETSGVHSMIIYYKHTFGSSFYPLTSNIVLLPFEANWYPQSTHSNIYTIDSSGTFHTNVETKKCKHIKVIEGKEKYSWHGDHLDCLSIIRGPYKQMEIENTKLIVYEPFLTKTKNYRELKNQLVSIRSELCELFTNLKNTDYCMNEIKTVVIIPKSLSTTNLLLYDSTVTNGSYTFYVDPFLDVNDKSVTAYVQELAAFLIPYRLFENEQISIFVGQYLMEKLRIPSSGSLKTIVGKSSISLESWNHYMKLAMEEKEKVLIQMAKEMERTD